MRADDRAGIENRVATDLNKVSKHRAEFLSAGGDRLAERANRNGCFVALYVRCHRTGTHVRAVAKDRIANVVEVRNLHTVKQNTVL